MKIKLLISFFIIYASFCFPKVWRVDLNPANHPDFTNLQAAVDNASLRDTLYVAGHPGNYGSLTIQKEIVLIGAGYFLTENLSTQAYPFSAKIYQITFETGGSNTVVCGFEMTYLTIRCSNVTIQSNYIHSDSNILIDLSNGNCNNIIIEQNYLSAGSVNNSIPMCIYTINNNNVIIRNNFIYSETSAGISGMDGSTIIYNNVINSYLNIPNSSIYNNILNFNSKPFYNEYNNLYRNNLYSGPTIIPGPGNQSNVDMSTVFVGTGSIDSKLKLKEGSPYRNWGLYGEDCGMFGGEDAYVLSGIPPIPTIYQATIPSAASEQDGLKVTIKAKTNSSGTVQQEGSKVINKTRTNK
jgi:hypothetical protein